MLRWMDVDANSALLASEHPQVGALILSVLVPDVAARAIEKLHRRLQADLVLSAAPLTPVPNAAIEGLGAGRSARTNQGHLADGPQVGRRTPLSQITTVSSPRPADPN